MSKVTVLLLKPLLQMALLQQQPTNTRKRTWKPLANSTSGYGAG
jgi:hypothetical protein